MTRLPSELLLDNAGFLQADRESARLRVRLDLSSADKNMLLQNEVSMRVKKIEKDRGVVDRVAYDLCMLMQVWSSTQS